MFLVFFKNELQQPSAVSGLEHEMDLEKIQNCTEDLLGDGIVKRQNCSSRTNEFAQGHMYFFYFRLQEVKRQYYNDICVFPEQRLSCHVKEDW